MSQLFPTVQKTIQKWAGGAGLTKVAIQHLMQMEGLQPFVWIGMPGNVCYLRSAPYRRILWVAEGSVVIDLPDEGRRIKLEKGDRLDLPPGIPHQAFVGRHGLVCLEAHYRLIM